MSLLLFLFFFGKISVIVQIKFIKTEKIKAIWKCLFHRNSAPSIVFKTSGTVFRLPNHASRTRGTRKWLLKFENRSKGIGLSATWPSLVAVPLAM